MCKISVVSILSVKKKNKNNKAGLSMYAFHYYSDFGKRQNVTSHLSLYLPVQHR